MECHLKEDGGIRGLRRVEKGGRERATTVENRRQLNRKADCTGVSLFSILSTAEVVPGYVRAQLRLEIIHLGTLSLLSFYLQKCESA